MGYQALYRVWRPQAFEDVIGQEHVTKTLQNALLHQKISHAYLFSGPRGTGKTSAAKILAKAVNCEHAPVQEPCNECASCRGITDGSISDVLEIDAASNNGVEEIRDIRDKVKYAPSSVKYKVYIIDEVHMLSTGAFNALLKTLEEPPAHVIFILATTEPHKIPLTIISRCQRFDFKRITPQDIVGRMERILKETGIAYDQNALLVIARAAEGGMRDALSLLDQAISFGSDNITLEDALTVTGAVSQSFLTKIVSAIHERDTAEALNQLQELLAMGKDPIRFVEDMILYFRDMLLYQAAPELEDSMERVYIDQAFKELAENISSNQLHFWIDQWNRSIQEMKWSSHPRIFLEVLLVRLCQSEPESSKGSVSDDTIQKLMNKINHLEAELNTIRENGVTVNKDSAPAKEKPKTTTNRSFKVPVGRVNDILKRATKPDLLKIKSSWGGMLESLKKSQAALLNDAEPVAAANDAFVLKFKYEIHCQMAMNNQEFISGLKGTLQQVTNNAYDIVGIPEESWQKIRQEFVSTQKQDQQESNETNNQEAEDPLILKARELFGDELLEIKD